jgi:hypothetical protein
MIAIAMRGMQTFASSSSAKKLENASSRLPSCAREGAGEKHKGAGRQ